jgi:glucans biosynthesis protein
MNASVTARHIAAPLPSPPPRRGWLRHGNRPGDYAKAPRCGARTRSGGCCRQPAMRNGRCRMHGGLSTGPRTAEGLERSRRARWKHGFCSTETRELRRAVAHTCRALAATTRLARAELRRRRGAGPAGARPAVARPASSGADALSLGMGFIERILSAAGSSSGAPATASLGMGFIEQNRGAAGSSSGACVGG